MDFEAQARKESTFRYDEVDANGAEPLLPNFSPSTRKTAWWRTHAVWFAHGALLLTSVVILAIASFKASARDASCLKKHSVYSPALRFVSEDYETRRFQGSFSTETPYKGPPSPEVEAAWEALWKVGPLRISEDEFQQMNEQKHSVKVPEKFGGGRLATLEFQHQIHCVYHLWKRTYPDYFVDDYRASVENASEYHEHTDHCADILRQKLLCDADVGMITFNWQKHHLYPKPNFNTEHKCHTGVDKLSQYSRDEQLRVWGLRGLSLERPTDEPWVEFDDPPWDVDA